MYAVSSELDMSEGKMRVLEMNVQ